jgi:hypothetical protein
MTSIYGWKNILLAVLACESNAEHTQTKCVELRYFHTHIYCQNLGQNQHEFNIIANLLSKVQFVVRILVNIPSKTKQFII